MPLSCPLCSLTASEQKFRDATERNMCRASLREKAQVRQSTRWDATGARRARMERPPGGSFQPPSTRNRFPTVPGCPFANLRLRRLVRSEAEIRYRRPRVSDAATDKNLVCLSPIPACHCRPARTAADRHRLKPCRESDAKVSPGYARSAVRHTSAPADPITFPMTEAGNKAVQDTNRFHRWSPAFSRPKYTRDITFYGVLSWVFSIALPQEQEQLRTPG